MGRDVKRVPLDFDQPLNEVWPGFLMPDSLSANRCGACDASGYGREAWAIANTFYPHQVGGNEDLAWCDKVGQAEVDHLVAEGRLGGPTTAAEVNEANGRGKRMIGRLVHDGINRQLLIGFRCSALGIDTLCPSCNGEGWTEAYPGQAKAAEEWEPTQPPGGEGWQLWETVSEGSPVSPVFATAKALALWLTTAEGGRASGPSHQPMTLDGALRFVEAGWAPSFIVGPAGLQDGAHFVGDGSLR